MTIRALIEAVERGEWTVTHWRDFEAIPSGSGDTPGPILANRAYHGSLDAALALHESLLPRWRIHKMGEDDNTCSGWWAFLCTMHATYQETMAFDQPTPARALLLAILRAVEADGRQ